MKIKDIALSAAYVGQRVVKAICVGAQKVWSAVKYIVFKDPVVEQICVANFSSDGVGVTEEQAEKMTSIGLVFQRNTEITSFDELAEFENVKSIPQSAFYGCTNLKSIKFPEGLESIGVQSFQSCGLLSFTYPKSLKSIGNYAFMGCDKLKTIFADSIEHIFAVEYNYFPFQGLQERAQTTIYVNGEILTETDIPLGVEKIPPYIFYSNQNIVRIGIPQTITSIGGYSFAYCNNLESDIILPSGVTSVGDSAFRGCSNVASYSLNEGLTSIGQYAFSQIGNRETFIIPSTVTSIGGAAFFSSQIKNLIIKAVAPPTAGNILLSCDAIYVPDQSVKAYREASVWSGYADKIWPMEAYLYGIITFADPAVEAICLANWDTNGSGYISKEEAKAVTYLASKFTKNNEITSFDEFKYFTGVTEVKGDFTRCENLISLHLPDSVNRVYGESIAYCSKLETIYLSKGLTQCDAFAFNSDPALKKVYIDSLEHWLSIGMGNNASSPLNNNNTVQLYVDGELLGETVTIPSSITTLPHCAFKNSLTKNFILHDNITEIQSRVFQNCTNLTDISIPKKVTILHGYLFTGSGITSLIIHDSITSVDASLFRDCSNLNYIELSNNIKSIPNTFIMGSTPVSTLVFPHNVSSLASESLFYSKLKTMVFLSNMPPTAAQYSFNSVNAVYVPDETLDTYKEESMWEVVAAKIHPITDYVNFTDISTNLLSDTAYKTSYSLWDVYVDEQLPVSGAKSLVYDVANYDFVKLVGKGGDVSRLYCFINSDNEVIRIAEENEIAEPLYVAIPSNAVKMIINFEPSSTSFEVKVGSKKQ